MPATEETYRHQPILHLVFAISSIAMLLVTIWMVMADHLRPWKGVQREFQRVERKKLLAAEKEKEEELATKFKSQLDTIEAKIEAANKKAEENAALLRKVDNELSTADGTRERLDMEKRFAKTELDSKRSLYDGMIDREQDKLAREYLTSVVTKAEENLLDRSKAFEVALATYEAKKQEKEILLGSVSVVEKEKEGLLREYERVKRQIKQKDDLYGLGGMWASANAFLRDLPGIDIMAPTKIQQITLPELLINYNFKEVPRFDRCQTCHQGIDKLGYETTADGEKMPTVYKTHPFFTSGATYIDPHGKPMKAGLYLDANGPHPINSFGCTICHAGQGSGTDFTFASHTPDSLEQAEEWTKEHGWENFHFWDFPMPPDRFLESQCLKCHTRITDIPQAAKLQAGYQRIAKFGCTGCHQIGGEGATGGPDLSDERQVGPNLSHIAAKDTKEWVVKWIANPHAFRPDSRMPRFYGLANNGAQEDRSKNFAEIYAITHYMFTKSTPPEGFTDPPAATDPAKGRELFLQKGCLACHQHRPYTEEDIRRPDKSAEKNPAYKVDPAEPATLPAAVQKNALGDFGPNLSNMAAKFAGKREGLLWLSNWIQAPERYHPKSLMPNLQLTPEEAGHIASWILSVPAEWPVNVEVLAADSKEVKEAVDELVKLYVSKSGSFKKADGKSIVTSLSKLDDFVEKQLKPEEKLLYLGERTISRLGCFGCHTIPGFETAKPIGTALNDWGIKSPARLDYGHIAEYLMDQPMDKDKVRDGTDLFYQEKITHETRMGFLYQKLHRPRSYDYKKKSEKYKTWDDRLRMPQFAWANDPKAIEEVMTFVLGLTGEKINSKYLPASKATAAKIAVAEGAKILNRFNCDGCHVLEMPKYTIAKGTKVAEAMPDFKGNVASSYRSRNNDYLAELDPTLKYDPKKKLGPNEIEQELGIGKDEGEEITIEGMPTGLSENELTVQLWQPVKIRGYTFSVADNLTLDQTRVEKTPAKGGDFPFLYAAYQNEQTNQPVETFWNRLPPPLVREGNKVQTPWLSAFLHDPHMIRPAAGLRMPRFHFGKDEKAGLKETDTLASYFAARDRAPFPYQSIPEQNPAYIAERKKAHPDYLGAGWTMMTNKTSPCLQCHAIGQFKPSGGAAVVNGPDLRMVASRFQPGYLEAWVANPRRMLPFTAMPQNIAPHGDIQIPVPKTFENKPIDMVRAIRDTLLNYVDAVELQLASSSAAAAPAGGSPAAGTPVKATGNAP